jgi:hypothetical protein
MLRIPRCISKLKGGSNGGGDTLDTNDLTKGERFADHAIFMKTKPIADLFPPVPSYLPTFVALVLIRT